MPLGLWKSKWEIHREDMVRFWSEMDRRHDEFQRQMERRDKELAEEKDRRDRELKEEKARREEESARRDRELEERAERQAALDAQYREERERERAESEQRWRELREESDALRDDYNRELAQTRQFNREILLRMEKTYSNVNATLVYIGEELAELKAAVNAQTEAIMRLVDRFEEWEKRQAG